MAYLVLIRHGESQWNAKGLWTGLTDISLNEKGKKIARIDAGYLEGIKFHIAYTSKLKRAQETLNVIKKSLGVPDLPTMESADLNERDYGDLTGEDKWAIEKRFGEEQFLKWRRGWDESIPGGETLKDVYQRVIPYFEQHILPDIQAGRNVLVVAHGNSLRALVKYLEGISDYDIQNFELQPGEMRLYETRGGRVFFKESKVID